MPSWRCQSPVHVNVQNKSQSTETHARGRRASGRRTSGMRASGRGRADAGERTRASGRASGRGRATWRARACRSGARQRVHTLSLPLLAVPVLPPFRFRVHRQLRSRWAGRTHEFLFPTAPSFAPFYWLLHYSEVYLMACIAASFPFTRPSCWLPPCERGGERQGTKDYHTKSLRASIDPA